MLVQLGTMTIDLISVSMFYHFGSRRTSFVRDPECGIKRHQQGQRRCLYKSRVESGSQESSVGSRSSIRARGKCCHCGEKRWLWNVAQAYFRGYEEGIWVLGGDPERSALICEDPIVQLSNMGYWLSRKINKVVALIVSAASPRQDYGDPFWHSGQQTPAPAPRPCLRDLSPHQLATFKCNLSYPNNVRSCDLCIIVMDFSLSIQWY